MDGRMLKKPKVEEVDDSEARKQLEEALIVLIQDRTREVQNLKKKLTRYKSELDDAEKRLEDSRSQLYRLRSTTPIICKPAPVPSSSPSRSRPPLYIPPAPKILSPAAKMETGTSSSSSPPGFDGGSVQPHPQEVIILGQNKELISTVRTCTAPQLLDFEPAIYIPSNHKRKLRSIALNPVNEQLFATSSLDGVVNLWQLKDKGLTASLQSTQICLSPKLRRWPEHIAWHPNGDKIFAAYTADGGETQISILNFSLTQENVHFLEEKPHQKGTINCITFMPWEDLCFATGGSDHIITLWTEREGSWVPNTINSSEHSSAVMGIAGLQKKRMILSVGMDKRLVGFNLLAGTSEFKLQLDSKCMAVLANPSDFNLFMVQTGVHGKQLRLFDIRLRAKEIHAFGFQPEGSESHSGLIKPAWSPNGLHMSSGSTDPKIHIFDIRYHGTNAAQSLQVHRKRVLNAVWHQTLPLLVSISTDLHIGLHRIS